MKVLPTLRVNRGAIVLMDRAYHDYGQFGRWTEAGVFFVTRMVSDAAHEVLETRRVPLHRKIADDEEVLRTGPLAREGCPAHSGLERADGPAADRVASLPLQDRLVPVQPGALVRLNLFVCRDPREWLEDPLHALAIEAPPEQMELNLR